MGSPPTPVTMGGSHESPSTPKKRQCSPSPPRVSFSPKKRAQKEAMFNTRCSPPAPVTMGGSHESPSTPRKRQCSPSPPRVFFSPKEGAQTLARLEGSRCPLCHEMIIPWDEHYEGDEITGGTLSTGNQWDCKDMCGATPEYDDHGERRPCVHDNDLRWVHSSCAED